MDSIADLLDCVQGDAHMLTVYNYDGPEDVLDTFDEHFGRRNTAVEQATTSSGEPTDFAVLHDGDRFLAASPVEPAYRAIGFDSGTFSGSAFEPIEYPMILEHAATTAFTAYDKCRMILASREIETRAWRVGEGELYAGFQRLSVMRHQWDIYATLARSGVAVHAYGIPDWTPPSSDRDIDLDHDADTDGDGMTFHADDDREIRNSWFVVFDASEDQHKAALVSEEREPGEFYGFWTYEPALVDEIVTYFRNERTPVSPPGADAARIAD